MKKFNTYSAPWISLWIIQVDYIGALGHMICITHPTGRHNFKTQSVLAGDNIPRRNEDIGDFVTIFVEKTLPKVSLPFPGILLEINRDAEILYSDSEQGEYEVTALKDLARNNDPAQIKVSIPMLDIETLRGVHEIDRTLVDKNILRSIQ